MPGHSRTAAFPTGLALFLIACTLFAGGCTRRSAATDQAPDLRVEIVELRPDPPSVGEVVLTMRLTDARGSPLSGANLELKADMTHAGMTPVFGNVIDEGEGIYRSTFEWTMAGDWILTVSGTLEDGRVFHRELQVSVATDGG
jgi:hypothetical protein